MSSLLYEIPGSLSREINELESYIADFVNNTISDSDLKSKQVPFGIYEQRQKGTYMVRVRCTAGIITPAQLKRAADLSLSHASGTLHVTTRQEIQIHDVAIENLTVILRELLSVGLSTRGGGGNTVRNITAPWDSGIAVNETFDVTPYAIALTSAMIAREDSWLLPRKYKIAFSNSDLDTAFATVNDLGFIARIKDGVHGFRVFVAGGMGKQSQTGHVLHDFIPASEVFLTAESVKRLFSKHGDRQNRHTARLRFLWNTLGGDQFKFLYNEEKQRLISEDPWALSPHEIPNVAVSQSYTTLSQAGQEGFDLWSKRYTTPQKQPGSAR